MSKDQKLEATGSEYYAYVDRPNQPLFRQPVLAVQKVKHVIGEEAFAERSRLLLPDGNGVIIFSLTDSDYKSFHKAMETKKRRDNIDGQPVRVVGPFVDKEDGLSGYIQARTAAEEARPKTAEEQVVMERAENVTLRAQIAELKKTQTKKEN